MRHSRPGLRFAPSGLHPADGSPSESRNMPYRRRATRQPPVATAPPQLKAEDVERVSGRHILELGKLRQDVVANARANQHGDILLAVDRIGDRRRIDAGADIEAPQL